MIFQQLWIRNKTASWVVVVLEFLEVKRLKQQLTQKTENLCPGIQETKLRLPESLGVSRFGEGKFCVDTSKTLTTNLRLLPYDCKSPGTAWRTGSSSCKSAWRSVKPCETREMSLVGIHWVSFFGESLKSRFWIGRHFLPFFRSEKRRLKFTLRRFFVSVAIQRPPGRGVLKVGSSHFVMLGLAGISGATSTDQSSRRGEAQGATSDATWYTAFLAALHGRFVFFSEISGLL